MAWTAPSGKTDLGTISVADWNTYVRDNLAATSEPLTVGLTNATNSTSTYTIANNTDTTLFWRTSLWDSHSAQNPSNDSQLTCSSDWEGVWLVTAVVSWKGGDSDGYRRIRIVKNGSVEWAQSEHLPATGNARVSNCCTALVDMSAGDYIDVRVLQNSGRTLSIMGNADDDEIGCRLQAIYLGSSASSSTAFSGAGIGSQELHEWWNTEIAGSFARLRHRPMCRVSTGGTYSLISDSWESIPCPSEQFDTDGIHSTVTNTHRMTAPRSGYYVVVAQANFGGNANGQRMIRFIQDDFYTGSIASAAPIGTAGFSLQAIELIYMNAGSWVTAQPYQASGTTMTAFSMWQAMFWAGNNRVAARQRLERWNDDPYAGGAQAGILPHSWCDIHARDLHGHMLQPPMVKTRAQFTPDITVGEWKKVKFNRQTYDTWNTVKGKRNFGEKYVVPMDGMWLTGTMIAIRDDPAVDAKFTVPTATFTVATATDIITSNGHGLKTGQAIRFSTTGTIPAGLAIGGADHYVRVIDANTFRVFDSRRDAQRNNNQIDITSTGTGTHRWSLSRVECRGLNLRNGTRIRVSTTGTLPAGLSAGTDYYVIRITKDRFRLSDTDEGAEERSYLSITDSGSGTHTLTVQEPYGSRGCRIVHSGEVQGGWHGSPSPDYTTCHGAISLLAAQAEDELWVEAITRGPEGSRITAGIPQSNWWAVWLAPFDYTGAEPIAERS